MEELIRREGDPPMLYVDNIATISLIKNPVLHDRSKHIEIRFHYIRECANRGLIKSKITLILLSVYKFHNDYIFIYICIYIIYIYMDIFINGM